MCSDFAMKSLALLSFLILAQSSFCFEDVHHPKISLGNARVNTADENADYWTQKAEAEIEMTKNRLNTINTNVAKNVIIFIGDGMSLPTVTASRIYRAQYEGRDQGQTVNGEESLLTFEKFPHVGLSKTYCVDAQTADSASTATAMFTGVKTNHYTLGFDNSIILGDIESEWTSRKVDSILKWAQDAGKNTGFVTTARVSHATPAALYAHSADRYWECNKKFTNNSIDSTDITWQLIHTSPGMNANVILGGGRSSFLPVDRGEDEAKYNYSTIDWDCLRKDNLNLIQEFLNRDDSKVRRLVENRGELSNLDFEKTDQLLGLFSWDHMKYEYEREKNGSMTNEEPAIWEMTEAAIKMLKKNENGFFLMVEGGRVDMAHHEGWANVALHETMALDKAVETAMSMVNLDETLIIVTADHGHTMSMAGYQTRGADIRGIVDNELGSDNLPYNILTYANGPGFYEHLKVSNDGNITRANLSEIGNLNFEFHQPSTAPLKSETHSGADVGIFATGPYSHFFTSVHEQNYIAHVMAYSACIGPYSGDKCHKQAASASVTVTTPATAIVFALIVSAFFSKLSCL